MSKQMSFEKLREWGSKIRDILTSLGPADTEEIWAYDQIFDIFNEKGKVLVEVEVELERLKKWVADLQSGGYVNCVYCGYRYGPKETTPVSMAVILKAHIEVCPKHPMSALTAQKDSAYAERNKLVAMLCHLYPSSLERHPEEDKDWEDDWRWIVFIDLPSGQVSWHIHDRELNIFGHVKRFGGRKWDGHTTEEKYKRCAEMILFPVMKFVNPGEKNESTEITDANLNCRPGRVLPKRGTIPSDDDNSNR